MFEYSQPLNAFVSFDKKGEPFLHDNKKVYRNKDLCCMPFSNRNRHIALPLFITHGYWFKQNSNPF